MKRPSFQFYPEDWLSSSNLRRCSHEEKGVWIDVLCLLHDQEEYGVVRWPLKDLAQAVGCTPAKLQALVSKGVLKGADPGQTFDALIFTPRHSRKDGEPVTLLEKAQGPVWYSSRMVTDEYKRLVREGVKTPPKAAPMGGIGAAPNPTPDLSPSRAGAPSLSPSLSPTPNRNEKPDGADAPRIDHHEQFTELWTAWPAGFGEKGSRKNALAAFLKLKPDAELFAEMCRALDVQALDKATKATIGAFASPFQHVERWLKNRRWEDEIDPVSSSAPDAASAELIAQLNDRSWAEEITQ